MDFTITKSVTESDTQDEREADQFASCVKVKKEPNCTPGTGQQYKEEQETTERLE